MISEREIKKINSMSSNERVSYKKYLEELIDYLTTFTRKDANKK